MELKMDDIVFSKAFRERVLLNSTITVFKIYPPTERDLEFQQPYMFGVSEFENALNPYLHPFLMTMAKDGRCIKAAFVIAAFYIIFIFALKKWMESRPRFELKKTLVIWNTSLAVFSVLGVARSLPEFVDIMSKEGLPGSVCNSRARYTSVHLWGWLFVFSKVWEMVDTVFVVLRKQPLIFLHYYHHAATMLYVWHFTVLDACAPGRWFMLMNFAVHSLMYSYYALRAARLQWLLPVYVSIAITSAQITQMLVACSVVACAWSIKWRGGSCHITYVNLVFCSAMYLSYVVLFANFFCNAYISDRAKKGKVETTKITKKFIASRPNIDEDEIDNTSIVLPKGHVMRENNQTLTIRKR